MTHSRELDASGPASPGLSCHTAGGHDRRCRPDTADVPEHFAERYALIMIIALGESIVAIGVGLEGLDIGVAEVAAATVGVGISAALWWVYFDVVALVAARRLERAAPGRERNEIARDSFTAVYLSL